MARESLVLWCFLGILDILVLFADRCFARADDAFWPRMLKDKLKEKNQVQIDWSRYVDEDEAEEKGGFDTSSFGPGAMVRVQLCEVTPASLSCHVLRFTAELWWWRRR